MRVGPRITWSMLGVACLPLGLAGWNSIRLADEALRGRTSDLHATVAQLLADAVGDSVRSRLHGLRLAAAAVRFDELAADEQVGALRLVFRQVEDMTVLALLDADGEQVTRPVYLGEPSSDPMLANRPAVVAGDVDLFAQNIPFEAARSVGAAVGQPYVSTAGEPRLGVAVKADNGHILVAEFSLNALITTIAEPRLGPRGRAFVTDTTGRVLLDQDRRAVAERDDRSGWKLVETVLAAQAAPTVSQIPGLGAAIGAGARVADLGWAVVVAEPVEDALAASRTLLWRTLLWIAAALAAAGLLGLASTRAIMRPIRALHAGATSLARAELGHRVGGVDGADELGDLARAFNGMAAEVERWNRELEARVTDRTRELKEAQELLLRAQNLAAVGQLGAGVAHEINNPLTGVIGLIQVILAQEEKGTRRYRQLETIEREALRIREIVDNLRRFTEGQEGVNLASADLAAIAESSLSMSETQLRAQRIEVVRELDPAVPPVLGDGQRLREVFLELITNARRAMPGGGRLTIGLSSIDGQLSSIAFTDTGTGISPENLRRIFEPFFSTKTEWQAKGLGLTMVHEVIEAHRGKIVVESELGKGTSVIITLPAVQKRTLA